MKLALMCHQHPDHVNYHELRGVEKLDAIDYRSRCFVCFVETGARVTECPRCGALHEHLAARIPA